MSVKAYYKEKEYIHYSNCHEDFEMLYGYLKDSYTEILSVASALDNSLGFLVKDGAHVVAFDYNITQIYLCRLKKTAIELLSREEFLTFIGVSDGDSGELYNRISPFLDEDTKKYFDEHLFLIRDVKLVRAGRFEYYLGIFAKKVLPLVSSKKYIEEFAAENDIDVQQEIYVKRINNLRLKLLFKIFFSEAVMKRLGRDKEFFKYNKGSLSEKLKKRFDMGVANVVNGTNPYLGFALLNNYKTLPFYLLEGNYYRIKNNIKNIEIIHATMDEMLGRGVYDFIDFSDVFEYLPSESMEGYTEKIRSCLNDGGRAAFWNMMNTRKLEFNRINDENDLKRDKAFFYKDFLVYEK